MITPAVLFTKQYWINLVTIAVGAFITSFLGFLAATTSIPSVHSVEAAGWAALVAAVGITLHSTGVTAQAKTVAASAPAKAPPSTTV